jgi:WD40 repeat protein
MELLNKAAYRGNAAWCESTQTLLVWNLCDGIDIYRIDDRPIWIGKLAINISRNMVVQVSFGVEPFAISGSDRGDIYVWDLKTRSLQQVLRHDAGICYSESLLLIT